MPRYMKNLASPLRLSATALLITSLAACGGGGSSSGNDSTNTSTVTATVPAVTEATPAATASTPTGGDVIGTLPTLAFTNAGTSTVQNVVITGTSPNNVMTFSSPAFTVTGAGTNSPTFSAQSGREKANGNVIVYCSAGETPQSTSDTGKVPFQQGTRIFISANLTAVSDAAVMRGLSFTDFDCAGSTTTMQANTDGTYTRVDPAGTRTLTAAEIAQFFSADGFTGPGGGNYKTRAYKYTIGQNSRYFTVTKVQQVNPTANYVILGLQTP